MLKPILIESKNCLTAWKAATSYMLSNGDGFNLIVHIVNPLEFTAEELSEVFNNGLIRKVELQNVINTIFPNKLYEKYLSKSIADFYDHHEKLYNRGKSMHSKNRNRWGNYFLRFTRFGFNKKNQLQNIIESINRNHKSFAAAYYIHTSSVDYDSNIKMRGNPCLQYLQFGVCDDQINLTAVYRNHDFYNKALGNYIGLSKLLEFVCEKTNKKIGSFTCHSIHYYLLNKSNVRVGINNINW